MIYPGAGDPCAECAEALRDGLIQEQACDKCEYNIHLLPEAAEPWELALRAAPGMFRPDGGVDYGALACTFDFCGVPHEAREELFMEIMGVIEARSEHLEMEAEKARRRGRRG